MELRTMTRTMTLALTALLAASAAAAGSARSANDLLAEAHRILSEHPLIDTHIDVPFLARMRYANQLDKIDLNTIEGHLTIPKLREGKLGGFFWSLFIPTPSDLGYDEGRDFVTPAWSVRDTIEQLDITKLLIKKYSETFELATSAEQARQAFAAGKVASFLGIEGGHQLGSSLSSLRHFHEAGVRYVTLTHSNHSSLADSSGYDKKLLKPRWGGLSPFGRHYVKEANRIGMIVDVSHTSADTARQALALSRAPVIFSHSNARALCDSVRNVPTDVLDAIGRINHRGNKSKRDQVTFTVEKSDKTSANMALKEGFEVKADDALISAFFIPEQLVPGDAEGNIANIRSVADHIEYIASRAGRNHVGIGSDFDGTLHLPKGLEDVSKYPSLIAELLRRDWKEEDVIGLIGGNLLRVMEGVERVAHEMQEEGIPPDTTLYELRPDLPLSHPPALRDL